MYHINRYIKFGAVRPGIHAAEHFEQLLDLCEIYGETQKMSRLMASVNTSHDAAPTKMVAQHFRNEIVV